MVVTSHRRDKKYHHANDKLQESVGFPRIQGSENSHGSHSIQPTETCIFASRFVSFNLLFNFLFGVSDKLRYQKLRGISSQEMSKADVFCSSHVFLLFFVIRIGNGGEREENGD